MVHGVVIKVDILHWIILYFCVQPPAQVCLFQSSTQNNNKEARSIKIFKRIFKNPSSWNQWPYLDEEYTILLVSIQCSFWYQVFIPQPQLWIHQITQQGLTWKTININPIIPSRNLLVDSLYFLNCVLLVHFEIINLLNLNGVQS